MGTEVATDDPLVERLRGFLSDQIPARRRARVPVNEAMIAHWCDALGERNPAYPQVAPPAMLQSWCMEGEVVEGEPIVPQVMEVLDEAGYASVVATDYEQEYERALRPGDLLTETAELEEVSERKRTGLGEGYFVTFLNTYRDEVGEVVGRARMRVLKFKAAKRDGAGAGDEPAVPRPRPVVNRDNAFFWEGVEAGELRIQRCGGCGRLRHPPAPMCAACRSLSWDWVVASGRGTVHSFVVHHAPPLPGFAPPFVVVLVDLEEGTRIVSNLVGVEPAAVEIGQPVRLDIVRVDDELVLPLFRPAEPVA